MERVSFLDADHAQLVFMTYYGGSPSPVLTEPFDADVVRVDGRVEDLELHDLHA